MRREEPAWWYSEQATAPAYLLRPVAALYDAAARLRFALATPYRSRLPVVCVGNLTVGGAGKTPLALAVARHLQARGERPAFLTRGYGGSLSGPLLIDPAIHGAAQSGDEPRLLARVATTCLARDRAAGARLIETGPATVIIMDDGLQNPGLAKDLSLAVVDGERGIGNGRVLPAGPLRAGLRFQLGYVDALVMSCAADEPVETAMAVAAPLRHRFAGPILVARVLPDPTDAAKLKGRRVLAFAGIGRPGKLFDTLRAIGAEVTSARGFPDHHTYGAGDAAGLLAEADRLRAQLVTTEKDVVRLAAAAAGPLAELAARAMALRIRLALEVPHDRTLDDLLDNVLNASARASAGSRYSA